MKKKISVVIPTLGGSHLFNTINHLNKGTLVPNEIILSITKKTKIEYRVRNIKNIRIIQKSIKGQVMQRIEGFKHSKNEFVLQLDDDIILEKLCLYYLFETLNKNKKKIAVSPIFLKKEKSSKFDQKPKNFLFKFYHFLLNGKKNYNVGTVSLAGIPYYFENISAKKITKVEWLSGGCILHKKRNLILKNYFPFKIKKAFCEDLIHSKKLIDKKVNLYLCTRAKAVYKDFEGYGFFSLRNFFKELKEDYLSRSYYIKISKKSFLRMNFYYITLILRFFFKKIKD